MVPTILTVLGKNSEAKDVLGWFRIIAEHPALCSELEIDVPNENMFLTLLKIKNMFLKEDEEKKEAKRKPLEGFVMWYDIISKIKEPKEFLDLCRANNIVFELHENKPIPKPLYESFVSEMKPKSRAEKILGTLISSKPKKRLEYEDLNLPSM